MMQGLKLYCCALCLCEFGCELTTPLPRIVTATSPTIRKTTTGMWRAATRSATRAARRLASCSIIPARVEADLRVQIEQEKRLKNREASMARRTCTRKAPALTDEARQKQAEQLFLRGLIDACPRCGFEAPKVPPLRTSDAT